MRRRAASRWIAITLLASARVCSPAVWRLASLRFRSACPQASAERDQHNALPTPAVAPPADDEPLRPSGSPRTGRRPWPLSGWRPRLFGAWSGAFFPLSSQNDIRCVFACLSTSHSVPNLYVDGNCPSHPQLVSDQEETRPRSTVRQSSAPNHAPASEPLRDDRIDGSLNGRGVASIAVRSGREVANPRGSRESTPFTHVTFGRAGPGQMRSDVRCGRHADAEASVPEEIASPCMHRIGNQSGRSRIAALVRGPSRLLALAAPQRLRQHRPGRAVPA